MAALPSFFLLETQTDRTSWTGSPLGFFLLIILWHFSREESFFQPGQHRAASHSSGGNIWKESAQLFCPRSWNSAPLLTLWALDWANRTLINKSKFCNWVDLHPFMMLFFFFLLKPPQSILNRLQVKILQTSWTLLQTQRARLQQTVSRKRK